MRLDTWGSRGLGLCDLSFTGKSNLRGFDDFDPDDIHSNLHRACGTVPAPFHILVPDTIVITQIYPMYYLLNNLSRHKY